MVTKDNLEDFFIELISLKQKEISLSIKKEITSSLDESKCKISHSLVYKPKEKGKGLEYYFDDNIIKISSLNEKTSARLLYNDLQKVLTLGKNLTLKGIEISVSLNGAGLPYIGHQSYLDASDNLDILSLPNLLLDIKRKYRL